MITRRENEDILQRARHEINAKMNSIKVCIDKIESFQTSNLYSMKGNAYL